MMTVVMFAVWELKWLMRISSRMCCKADVDIVTYQTAHDGKFLAKESWEFQNCIRLLCDGDTQSVDFLLLHRSSGLLS
jgi:hypothetical protein